MIKTFFLVATILLVNTLYAQTELWGMTEFGGQYDSGVIFKVDSSGNNQSVEYNFFKASGANPLYTQLLLASDSMLYGLTSEGDPTGFGLGFLFQYNPYTSIYTSKVQFDGINLGSTPKGSLIQASDGKLYGMTYDGGANNIGTLFQYDINTNTLSKKVDFNWTLSGMHPTGSLVQAPNGMLYGMTPEGGANSLGVLFQYDPNTSVLTKKLDFAGATNGATPYGGLMLASNGKLYGVTNSGGTSNSGVIFEYDFINNTLSKKINLGVMGMAFPKGTMYQATDGNLYGLSESGGTSGYGVLFQYNYATNTVLNKFSFNTADGYRPNGSLIQASDGNLYGLTHEGGVNNHGVLFQFNPTTNVYAKKFDFSIANGIYPFGSLIQARNGMIYGMNNWGGTNKNGVLYEFNPITSSFSSKIDFGGAKHGNCPKGSLLQSSNGKLYGMTSSAGVFNHGVLFEYNLTTHSYTKKFDFDSIKGRNPNGSLIEASNGKLYGLTTNGGVNDLGALFEYDTISNTVTKKFDFDGVNNGSQPMGSLVQAKNRKLYGLTYKGGANNYGVIFQFDPITSVYTKIKDFNGNDPAYSIGSLMQASDGMLYGMSYGLNCPTYTCGGINEGILYKFDPTTNVLTPKVYFSSTGSAFTGTDPGFEPMGSLIEASDGKLYGMTSRGGDPFAAGWGVLFQYDKITNTYSKKFELDNADMLFPKGDLIEAANGKFYAMHTGGQQYGGVFNYDRSTDTVANICSFNVINGRAPCYSSLIETGRTISSAISTTAICVSSSVAVSYTVVGKYPPASIFTAQLSDASGSFMSAITIGTVASAMSGSISALIPSLTIPGNTYKIRVVGPSPSIQIIDNGINLSISNAVPSITITGASTVCAGSSSGLIVSGASNYSWYMGVTTSTVMSSVTYTAIATNGCGADTATVSVMVDPTCADIWPGDANSDGIANNLDILELGLHYTQTGSPRASASNNWQSYFANNWTGTITNGKNLNHSDCNGDGIIDANDTLAIHTNYGLTHIFKAAQTTTVNTQLNVVPDQAMVGKGFWGTASIYLGDATHPISNINGIAFTINFDKNQIEQNGMWIEYQNSFIDAWQNLHFQKLDFSKGKLFTATTHTANNNVSGFGKIATLHYQISSSLFSDQLLTIGLSLAYQSNASGTISSLTSGTGTLMAMGYTAGVEETTFNSDVTISPNPTNGLINISFSSIPQNIKIELHNSIGALVLSETMNNKINAINVSDLSSGIYFMKVLEGNRVVAVKKIVKE